MGSVDTTANFGDHCRMTLAISKRLGHATPGVLTGVVEVLSCATAIGASAAKAITATIPEGFRR